MWHRGAMICSAAEMPRKRKRRSPVDETRPGAIRYRGHRCGRRFCSGLAAVEAAGTRVRRVSQVTRVGSPDVASTRGERLARLRAASRRLRRQTSRGCESEVWWRRRESNPRPKARPRGTLHACPLRGCRVRRVEAAKYRQTVASENLAGSRRGATSPPACLMASGPQPPGEVRADVTA